MRFPKIPARRERILAGLAVGLLLLAFNYLLDIAFARMGISTADTIANDVIIGVVGAASAYLWVRFESERQARAREKLILAIELNHHIRNALTLISQCVSLEDEQAKYALIDAAVERIDRVLTELVPTVGDASAPRLFLEHDPPPRPATPGRNP